MNYSQRVGLGICLIGLALILFFISDLEFTALSVVGIFTGLVLASSGVYIAIKSNVGSETQ